MKLAGYRRFIDNFLKIAKSLTLLTQKDKRFAWSTARQHAFKTLKKKKKLTTAPVLNYRNFTKKFITASDASDFAIGAILLQGPVGQDCPIAYASRILNKAEQNYNTTKKELAIVWAVKYFRPYIYGTHFEIVTDHKPLTWLFSVINTGSCLIRWRLKLEEYDYKINRAGKRNANADALSRNSSTDQINTEEQKEEEYTEEEKQQLFYEFYNAPTGRHQRVERTLNRLKMEHKWPEMAKDVKKYIQKCKLCQKNKLKQKTKAPLIITDTPEKPFQKCALDIVGPLTRKNDPRQQISTNILR